MTARLPHSERLIVVVGPSGAGKDSVLQAWRQGLTESEAPAAVQRVITRPPDPAGEAHEPVEPAAFERLRHAEAFVFWWQAHGLHYGIRHEALSPLAHGRWVVMNGSRAHLPRLRECAPHARVVEITALPDALARRLAGRGREDAAAVSRRLGREAPASQADLVICNEGTVADAAQALHRWWRTLAVPGPADR